MSAVSAAGLLLRRLRAERGILLLLFALVITTSFLFAAAPRLFNRVTDDAARYAVSSALPVQRDMWLYATGTIGAGTDSGVAAVQAYGQQRQAEFPPTVGGLIGDRITGITSVRFAVPDSIVAFTLRYQDGATDASRLVSGRWPVDRGMPLKQLRIGQQPDPSQVAAPTVFEVAVSSDEADAIGAHVGDRFTVALDSSDSLVPQAVFAIAPTEIDVVGIYEPVDPNADVWTGSGLLQPSLKQGADGVVAIYVNALVPPESYPRIAAGQMPFRYDWHFQTDASQLDSDQIEPLEQDLQRMSANVAPTDTTFLPDTQSVVTVTDVSLGTALTGILDAFAAQRARSESVLSIAALGPLVLAAGATAMLAVLLVRRRRSSLLLARGRGASGSLLLAAQLVEAIVIAGIASLIGLLLAIYAVPARDSSLSAILALIVAVAVTIILVAATWPSARKPLMQLERDDPSVLRVPPRRLVIEGTVVVIAVVAVALLEQRGLTLGTVGQTVQFDPLLAAVPLLAGLAAGIIAMRLYPLPVRGLGALTARRRDFVPVVGLRTVARHPAIANLPLLLLMLTAAFAAFASVIESSIDRGQVAASYLDVGADYRLERIGIGGLPPSFDVSSIPGVEAVASGVVNSSAALAIGTNQRATVDLDAVSAAAYANVTQGTAADPNWPKAFFSPPSGQGVGTPANPIPAVLSNQVPPGIANIGIGDTITVTIAQEPLIFRVIARQSDFPGHGDAATFVIVPIDWVKDAIPSTTLLPSVMWLRASSDAAGPLEQAVAAAPVATRIVSRQDAYALLHGAPLGSAVADGFGIALGVAVLYLAITLVGAVVMSASGRTRDLAYLRTLGVSGRQALGLTAVEHTPPVFLGLIPGILLGVAVAFLVEPGLGLSDFVGSYDMPLFVDWLKLAIVIVVLALVVIAAIGLGTWLAVRARMASALRIEDS